MFKTETNNPQADIKKAIISNDSILLKKLILEHGELTTMKALKSIHDKTPINLADINDVITDLIIMNAYYKGIDLLELICDPEHAHEITCYMGCEEIGLWLLDNRTIKNPYCNDFMALKVYYTQKKFKTFEVYNSFKHMDLKKNKCLMELYCLNGDLARMKKLYESSKIVLDERGKHDLTILACELGHEDIVIWILKNSTNNPIIFVKIMDNYKKLVRDVYIDLINACCISGSKKLLDHFMKIGGPNKVYRNYAFDEQKFYNECFVTICTRNHIHLYNYFPQADKTYQDNLALRNAKQQGNEKIIKLLESN